MLGSQTKVNCTTLGHRMGEGGGAVETAMRGSHERKPSTEPAWRRAAREATEGSSSCEWKKDHAPQQGSGRPLLALGLQLQEGTDPTVQETQLPNQPCHLCSCLETVNMLLNLAGPVFSPVNQSSSNGEDFIAKTVLVSVNLLQKQGGEPDSLPPARDALLNCEFLLLCQRVLS